MNELVSVVIPTYQRSDTLLRAVNSALAQTYSNIEVIVIDDNNPNDKYSLSTQERLKSINDPRLRYVQQKKHINGAVARNVGIKEAKGYYIAFLDDDDEWNPQKIEKQIIFLKKMNVQGVSCFYDLYKNGVQDRKGPQFNEKDLLFKILSRKVQMMAGSSFICKRKELIKSGMFDESFVRHQDLQMLVDFLENNKVAVLPEYLLTIHVDSTKNQPDVFQFIEVKKNFLQTMESRINKMPKKQRKRVYAAHYFEVAVKAIKEKEILLGFKYLRKIGLNPIAYKDVFERFIDRKKQKGK